ncbi:MAG: hypothetical protein CL946_04275 [Ectothiorhodospiraceae bacterium]|nr:hypothetical protein [Ectothiorhodospiraceae bacterium]
MNLPSVVQFLIAAGLLILPCLPTHVFAQGPAAGNLSWYTQWALVEPENENDTSGTAMWMYGEMKYCGLAHDVTRDVLYVISPGPHALHGEPYYHPKVLRIDAETGALLGELPMDTNIVRGGLDDGTFALYRIRVDGKGRIYACNVTAPGEPNASPLRVYCWDSDTSMPRLLYEDPMTGEEIAGTALEVSGNSWNPAWNDSTVIYVSSGALSATQGDGKLFILQEDERPNPPYAFRLTHIIQNSETSVQMFGAGIARVAETRPVPLPIQAGDLFIAAPGGNIRRIAQPSFSTTVPQVSEASVLQTYAQDTAPREGIGIGGPLAIAEYGDMYPTVITGRMTAGIDTSSGLNYYTVADSYEISHTGQSGNRFPQYPTPHFGYDLPDQLAGQCNIADIDNEIYIHPTQDIPYFKIYYLLSNAGIASFISHTPMFSPVELSSFSAQADGNAVYLEWATESETNNRGFEIERAYAAPEMWETVGFVPGKGTTSERSAYSYQDNIQPSSADLIYYRLRQVDFDGTFEYSPVVEVAIGKADEFALSPVYPNPASLSATLRYTLPEQSHITLEIFDALGRKARTVRNELQSAGIHTTDIDLAGLPSGMYHCVLRSGEMVRSRRVAIRR